MLQEDSLSQSQVYSHAVKPGAAVLRARSLEEMAEAVSDKEQ